MVITVPFEEAGVVAPRRVRLHGGEARQPPKREAEEPAAYLHRRAVATGGRTISGHLRLLPRDTARRRPPRRHRATRAVRRGRRVRASREPVTIARPSVRALGRPTEARRPRY